ncbi:MAG TPA: hypothetical protein VMD29_00375 [Terracidiphilus sp.]|nr:hypothetical protein [Terracidiphilus sp.]
MTNTQCRFLALLLVTAATVRTEAEAQNEAAIDGKARVQISAPVRDGAVFASVGWTVDMATGEDVLRGSIAYRPDSRSAGGSCRSIRFVQVARVERSGDVDYDWKDGEANRNLMRTSADPSRGVKEGYFVDHDAFKCSRGGQCSPYFRDYWPSPDESQDGFLDGRSFAKASLVDYPFGWENFESITLESCARCADDGRFLACVEWGGRWPGRGDRIVLPVRVDDRPSPTFVDALRRFNAFYSNSDGFPSSAEALLSGGN